MCIVFLILGSYFSPRLQGEARSVSVLAKFRRETNPTLKASQVSRYVAANRTCLQWSSLRSWCTATRFSPREGDFIVCYKMGEETGCCAISYEFVSCMF